jgi:imidazolonepropionase-like amidohydrolase
MRAVYIFLLLMIANTAISQEVPTPAPKQSKKICVKGGTLHVGDGRILNDAIVCFDNGVFTEVFSASTIKTDETIGKVIDVNGKHIYPGFIAMNTTLGLTEIESVRATNDMYETGAFNPNARSVIAFNTDSRIIPTVRSNGVLYAQTTPQGGRIAGSSSLVQLDAWNWQDAIVQEDDGIFAKWPEMYIQKGWWAEPGSSEVNEKYEEQCRELKNYLYEAKSYCFSKNQKKNIRFEAFRKVFERKANLYVDVNFVLEIKQAITLAQELGIDIVIVGGYDSYLIADELAEKKVPVILSPPHSLPNRPDSDIKQPYKTASLLQKAGVLFAISIGSSWQERNLPFQAGTAVAYGLDKEAALSAISYNPAKIMKVADKVGTIEKGKAASFIIVDGDVLDVKSSSVVMGFIDGRQIDLTNKQTELSDKYLKKYNLK